jgi:hypothetical protein
MWSADRDAAIRAINHVDPWIIGCWEYHLPNSATPHFTRFAYIISQKDTDERVKNLPLDPDDVPADQLHVEPFLSKDSFAAD